MVDAALKLFRVFESMLSRLKNIILLAFSRIHPSNIVIASQEENDVKEIGVQLCHR